MTVNYNVTGARRKEMTKVISTALGGWTVEYLGVPSCSYRVGDFEIDRHGTLIFDDRTDSEAVESVLEALAQAGFECETAPEAETDEEEQPVSTCQFAGPYEVPWDEDCNQKEMTEEEMAAAMAEQDRLIAEAAAQQAEREQKDEAQETETEAAPMDSTTADEPISLSVSLPRESFTATALDNLDGLLESKGNLIRKAFGIEEASYTLTEDRITFDWLHGEVTPESSQACQDFIGKLCEMARNQKRVTAKPKSYENEKYAFRCFLLRLGLIGNEYKTSRKILLQNLSGNSSWKDGHRKEAAHDEVSEQGAD